MIFSFKMCAVISNSQYPEEMEKEIQIFQGTVEHFL